MLTIVTWLWGTKYSTQWTNKLADAIERNLSERFEFVVIHSVGDPLTKRPGCLVRLRMFDPQWQARYGLRERFVCIDLGVVITGKIDYLFDRPEPFVILQGGNATNPCPYNCGLMMLTPGYRPDVWETFSLEAARKIPWFAFPDDQSWIYHKIPNAAGWHVGPDSGIWSFKKRNWPPGEDLPSDARMVVFPGSRKPDQFTHLPWVRMHWQ
jgi:hypothetical protein